jgi:hypothetical protein
MFTQGDVHSKYAKYMYNLFVNLSGSLNCNLSKGKNLNNLHKVTITFQFIVDTSILDRWYPYG